MRFLNLFRKKKKAVNPPQGRGASVPAQAGPVQPVSNQVQVDQLIEDEPQPADNIVPAPQQENNIVPAPQENNLSDLLENARIRGPEKKSFFQKVGGFFGKIGKGLAAPVNALVKAHRKAVDNYNNYYEDYKKMSRWERFKWAVKNPIAWKRGGGRSSLIDTGNRNRDRGRLDDIAREAAGVLGEEDTSESLESYLGVKEQEDWDRYRNSRSNLEEPREGEGIDLQQGIDEEAPSGMKDKVAEATGKMALPLAEGNLALTYAPKLKDLPAPSPLVAKGMGAGAGAMSFVNSAMSAHDARKSGDNTTAVSEGFNAAGSASWALGGTADLLGDTVLPVIKDSIPLDKVLPGMDIFTGAATMASGITKYKGASGTKKNIGKIIENLQDPGKNLSEAEQAKYKRTLKQIQAFTGVDKVRGVTGMVSGANRIVGNALGFGPAAVLGPMIANVGSMAIDLAGDAIANKVASRTAKQVVNKDLDVEAKINAVQQWKGLNREQAKYVVFKSMGSTTGTREEAFQRMTMKRAMFLKNQADDASGKGDTNHVALQTMKAMNLSKNQDGEYDLQTITQKLGMGTDPWQEQLRKTLKKQNPFRSFKRERM